MRRLPVYLLLDCSESLIGNGIRQIERGVNTLLSTLRSDPHALETVWLSCITFDGEARVVFPLTEISEVQAPQLTVRPGTALGAALNLCADSISREVRKSTSTAKGDYRPLIILITDGQATDDCGAALRRIGSGVKPSPAHIYAIGCGDDVDLHGLKSLTDIVLHMAEMEEADFRKLFIWLTGSIQSASLAVDETDPRLAALAKLPDAVIKVDELPSRPDEGEIPRQVFIRCLCQSSKTAYLIRYRWDPRYEFYSPVGSHPLDASVGSSAMGKLAPVHSDLLNGAFACPFCGNPGASTCGNCGTAFCAPDAMSRPLETVCPHCSARLRVNPNQDGEGFMVRQSAG